MNAAGVPSKSDSGIRHRIDAGLPDFAGKNDRKFGEVGKGGGRRGAHRNPTENAASASQPKHEARGKNEASQAGRVDVVTSNSRQNRASSAGDKSGDAIGVPFAANVVVSKTWRLAGLICAPLRPGLTGKR
jgi:hypothetical protein